MAMGFHFQFTIKDANRLLFTLILFEICLTLIFALDVLLEMPWPIHKLFNLDGEATIPAWFSSIQLFLIGVLFLFSGHWPQKHRIVIPGFLLLVGMGFIFLSADEAAVIHEKITGVLKCVEWVPRFKGNHGIWIPVYFSIAVVLAVIGRRTINSVLKAYPRQAIIILSGFVVFLIGAVGLEIISYWYLRGTEYSFLYKVEVALEEFFEMAGASIILYGTILCALRDPELLETKAPTSPNQGHHRTLK